MKYRMSLTYPDGNSVKGKTHHLQWYNKLGLNEFNLEGKRVLDIATDEGWWAFYSEMQGANYVEACDVEKGELFFHINVKDIYQVDMTYDKGNS